ncbi:MAG: phosphotransferase [Caulobacter sp.]|nr:phosphotransferase [Caulobacter sp.]
MPSPRTFPVLPADRHADIEAALNAAFCTAELDGVTPLTGGLSGAGVYRIRVGGVPYVMRIEGARDAFRDPHRAYACMRIAADAMVAPRVRHADPEAGIAIFEHIESQPLEWGFPGGREALVVELAQTVRTLHEGPAFPPLIDYLDGLEAMAGQVRASGLVPAAVLDPALARHAATARAWRALPPELVASHNDLNPRNILHDGRRLWLVDWDAAFLADRWFDLAALANVFARAPDEEALLLKTYLGAPPQAADHARLGLARRINHLFYALAFLNAAAAERPGAVAPGGDAADFVALHEALGEGRPMLDTWEGRVAYGLARLAAV